MVDVAQLVRVSVCGTEGRGFEPRLPPRKPDISVRLFLCSKIYRSRASGNYRNKKRNQSAAKALLLKAQQKSSGSLNRR